MKELTTILAELESLQPEETLPLRLADVVHDLSANQDARLAIEPILRFIERHPHDDLGAPGPLVHFVERYYKKGYEPLLLESVRRRPTELNIWMLNRLINGSAGTEREQYLLVLREVARRLPPSDPRHSLAAEFLREHE